VVSIIREIFLKDRARLAIYKSLAIRKSLAMRVLLFNYFYTSYR
jgi:hypothetical protein